MAFMYYRAAQGGHKDIYAGLPLINKERLKLDTTTPFVPNYVKSNLTSSANPAQTYASRVQGRQILLENPARESRAKKERQQNRAARRAAGPGPGASSKSSERRKRGAWKLRKEETKFQLFLPLHSLWLGYMSELLVLSPQPAADARGDPVSAMPGAAGMHAKLIKADFHGSIMTVRQSKNPCLVGLSGIVVHETENAFKVITQSDVLKMIPKQNSIFVFAVPLYATPAAPAVSPASPAKTILDMPHIEFELYGNHFCYRAAERAGRKFKHKETIEL